MDERPRRRRKRREERTSDFVAARIDVADLGPGIVATRAGDPLPQRKRDLDPVLEREGRARLEDIIAATTSATGTKQSPPSGHRPSGPAAIGPMTNVTTRPSNRTATVIGFAGIRRYAYSRGPRVSEAISATQRDRPT